MDLETDLIQTLSENCVISEGNRARTIAIADTKLDVHVVTLPFQDNTKLLQQLNSGFRLTTNWNKYQWKISTERPNEYFNYIICFIIQK